VTNFQWLAKHHGLTGYAWQILRNCERGLHRWAEMEAEGEIQWNDDETQPLRYQRSIYGDFTESPRPTFNREASLLAEARRQAARFGLEVYHQGDCRGCSLYLYSQAELDERLERSETLRKPGMGISACYNSVGTAVC
jgi:predicted ester cyclase